MSKTILIIGESGTGKSTSTRNLNPEETYYINVINKPLPYRGALKKYVLGKNYFSSDQSSSIIKEIRNCSKNLAVKNIVIDDFQYIMGNSFMQRVKDKGFEKYNDFAKDAWEVLHEAINAREDLYVFVLAHSKTDEDGSVRVKTVGKLLDKQISLEGMVTTLFHSLVINNEYKFLTRNDGKHIAKSPMGLFDDAYIDNDLHDIKNKMTEYFEEDEKELTKDLLKEILLCDTQEKLKDVYRKAKSARLTALSIIESACSTRKKILLEAAAKAKAEEEAEAAKIKAEADKKAIEEFNKSVDEGIRDAESKKVA